ncbi:Crp/Fnr family transcriptional regulator [Thiothrix litoralis]|jgi:CRP-like cAMP-binding protein|uniref:Crp/Fnr family transcriptional regulator n=1 Tax=Thiothrix litoralis TaxID=2891210 RepID=A0ABX7WP75_9GAMM|nr:Crp/Fnr family transcriptional regulator [Thiothrix litoralis]QTR44702.1 Crp/Fnr family transcriptional regulator [Thiothrix litoralis]
MRQQEGKASSCLIERMRHYTSLSDRDEQLLRELEKDEISYRPRTRLAFSDNPSHLFVVKSGWLYRYEQLDETRRQVLRIHYPGDIVGLTDVAMKAACGEMMTVTKTVLCPFPKRRLDDIFIHSPRLTALLFSLGVLKQIVLQDRMKIMGRASAPHKVAHFMLEMHARLRIHSPAGVLNRFEMPLTQDVIGDAIGLTNVSVSNAMTQLAFEGYCTCQHREVTLHELDKLKKLINFQDRYFEIDTSWFPSG